VQGLRAISFAMLFLERLSLQLRLLSKLFFSPLPPLSIDMIKNNYIEINLLSFSIIQLNSYIYLIFTFCSFVLVVSAPTFSACRLKKAALPATPVYKKELSKEKH
jgi:hypothetical protein